MKTAYANTTLQSDQQFSVQCVFSTVLWDTILVLLMLIPLIF